MVVIKLTPVSTDITPTEPTRCHSVWHLHRVSALYSAYIQGLSDSGPHTLHSKPSSAGVVSLHTWTWHGAVLLSTKPWCGCCGLWNVLQSQFFWQLRRTLHWFLYYCWIMVIIYISFICLVTLFFFFLRPDLHEIAHEGGP